MAAQWVEAGLRNGGVLGRSRKAWCTEHRRWPCNTKLAELGLRTRQFIQHSPTSYGISLSGRQQPPGSNPTRCPLTPPDLRSRHQHTSCGGPAALSESSSAGDIHLPARCPPPYTHTQVAMPRTLSPRPAPTLSIPWTAIRHSTPTARSRGACCLAAAHVPRQGGKVQAQGAARRPHDGDPRQAQVLKHCLDRWLVPQLLGVVVPAHHGAWPAWHSTRHGTAQARQVGNAGVAGRATTGSHGGATCCDLHVCACVRMPWQQAGRRHGRAPSWPGCGTHPTPSHHLTSAALLPTQA